MTPGRFVHAYFHALTNRNYRLFWYGQNVSLIGMWMQQVSQAWLVLSLTKSPLLLGLAGAAQFLPLTCFSLFAGVVADRFSKRSLLLATQASSMILVLSLSVLTLAGRTEYVHVLVFSLLLGLINCLDMPARQALNVELVGREDAANAVALNSMTFNLARIVGPALGAVLMAAFGAGWCFLLNGLSYTAAIAGLWRIRLTPFVRVPKPGATVMKEIRDGFLYLSGRPQLGETLLLVGIVGTFVYNFNVLIPVLTRETFRLDETAYGLLMSCVGAGSLLGALTAGMRSRRGPRLAVSAAFSLAASLCLCLVGLTRLPVTAGVLLFVNGFLTITFATNSNSLLQMESDDDYRARVMSVYSLVFAGTTPVGNLFAGWAASRLGAEGALLVCGCLSTAACLLVIRLYRGRSGAHGPLAGNAA